MQGRPEEQICQFARWSCYYVKRQAGVLSGPADILSFWQGWLQIWFERPFLSLPAGVRRPEYPWLSEHKAGLSGQQNLPHIPLRGHERFPLVCLSEQYAPLP